MAHTLSITGAAATIQWGYHVAASLGSWSLARSGDVWVVTGTLLTIDEFRVSQRPLHVITPNGWRWRIDTLQIADRTLIAHVSAEVSHHEHSVCPT